MSGCREEGCDNCVFSAQRPDTSGGVVQAPVCIRVRPGWLERALFAAVFIQIMLLGIFLAYGSTAARAARDASLYNRMILCQIIYNQAPERYMQYGEYCPMPTPTSGPIPGLR